MDPANRAGASAGGAYTVVARRYRPQRFEEVVGQDHVVQALRNAIRLNRVTHAYLFSGTRGVGKTSIARIFAKCLNCAKGPTDQPDGTCDICQAIAAGQDVDVIEIDGASNNGVEAVRELRQNAGLRPSRARYKIYYIDEVHMLSTSAFNALLKTLEEPPEHVKFFFATTEPNKIPITVLSRCQRYDFAGITPEQIVSTLAGICESEKVAADIDALAVIARRASGSMRDSQSLLEQVLSFGSERLTIEVVQQLLGIASDDRTLDLLEVLSRRDTAAALRIVEQAASQGVQPADLLDGGIEFLRDVMVVSAGADVGLLATSPKQKPRLQGIASAWDLDTILAAQQIFAETRMRLRGSPHGRLLVELALARVARLENLSEMSDLIGRLSALESGGPVQALEKKKLTAPEQVPPPSAPVAPAAAQGPAVVDARPVPASMNADGPISPKNPGQTGQWDLEWIAGSWKSWVSKLPQDLASKLARVKPLAIFGPNELVIGVDAGYNWVADTLEGPDPRARVEAELRRWLDRAVTIRFERAEEPRPTPGRAIATAMRDEGLSEEPIVSKLLKDFEARLVHVEAEDDTPPG